jgi:hypothetical protein
MNNFQWGVLYALGWFLVLLDGWSMHTHVLALIGILLLVYCLWKTPSFKEKKDD